MIEVEAIFINGTMVLKSEGNISLLSPGVAYGWGLFETIKYSGKKLELFNSHMKRMRLGSEQLGLDFQTGNDELKNDCESLIHHYGEETGAIKISIVKGEKEPVVFISRRPFSYTPNMYKEGYSLGVSKVRRNESSNLVKIKSNNYLENVLELNKAKDQGHQEVIFFNTQGCLAEGSYTNIFCVKDQVLYTPDEESGILNGIMRETVLKMAEELGINTVLGKISNELFNESDEIFITNSLMGIMPVRRVENKEYDITGAYSGKLYKKLNQTDLTRR